MQTIQISKIKIGERQRVEFGPKAIQELKDSISTHGLIHAPVLTASGELVAGERRLRAMTELHQEGIPFLYEGEPVPVDSIPFTSLGEADPSLMAEVEFAENIFRVDLTWQERTNALVRLHELRAATNPKQTLSATAREVAKASGKEGKETSSVQTERRALAHALILKDDMDLPEVKRARSAEEAIKVILDKNEAKVKAVAAATANPTNNLHQLIHGDCLVEMKKLPSNLVDLILTDPPYGMKADKMGKGEFHMYDDSPEEALRVCKGIISEGFRIAKPKAILVLFCDADHFTTLRTFAAQQAWTCWRTPLVWRKGTDGHSPWGRAGFVRTYELALFAVKGQRELIYPGGPDVIDCKRPGRADRVHSAEKPIDLLRHFIRLACLPGQTVFDPCAGSGPIIEAANAEKVKVIAIEKEETYFNECVARLAKKVVEPIEDDDIPEI
jgi:DNA modification methylase/ParB-like chromosome segregation protein Spo0J